MRLRFLALSLLTVAVTGITAQAPALADSAGKTARFGYAPNRWAAETPNTPGGRYLNQQPDMTAVRHGSVTPNIMGLDKEFLKPAPPPPPPVVTRAPQLPSAPVVHTNVTPNMMSVASRPPVQRTQQPLKATPYSNQFGHPKADPPAPVVAHQPPMQAAPQKLPVEHVSSSKDVSAKLAHSRPHHHVQRSRSVSAHLNPPSKPHEQVAQAHKLTPVANYAGTNHYSQGSFVNGYQRRSVGTVHGEVVHR